MYTVDKWRISSTTLGNRVTMYVIKEKSNRYVKKVTSWEKERSGNHLLYIQKYTIHITGDYTKNIQIDIRKENGKVRKHKHRAQCFNPVQPLRLL